MQKLNCLIVEDEPLAARMVQSYIEQVSFLKLETICTDALAALEILKDKPIDVIFLDIHLPKLKGLDFLRTLQSRPKIIITSAYKHYALEGFELAVTDYLLKPFSFSRFLGAVNRLQPAIGETGFVASENTQQDARYFNINKKRVKIYLNDILFVESLKDYVKIYTKEKYVVTKFQLGELEQFLNNKNFLRIHRSFMVAKDKIESFSSSKVEINGKAIPIGRSYAEAVKKIFEN